ncbi:unnamed protein product, partial [Rotaria sordida]
FSSISLNTIINDSGECIEIQERLRIFINNLKIFKNNDKCMQYIESLSNDRFVLIINDCLRKKFISNVHHLRQINEPLSIKNFCKNNELNDNFIYSQLLNDYLLQIKSISNRQNELISLCKDEYKENGNELNIIGEFENDCPSNRTLRIVR